MTTKPIVNGVVTVEQGYATKSNHVSNFATPTDAAGVCGAAKAFLGELKDTDPDKAKVAYEWAQIMPGNGTKWPVVNERAFWVAGTIEKWTPPDKDVPFAHPFGADYSADVRVDAAYSDLIYNGPEPAGILHQELENGLFPHQNGGAWFYPAVGDRIVAYGDWIIDCGHPESYSSEIHPPLFWAFGHVSSDFLRTESHAFAVPYRTTQLYHPDGNVASNVSDYTRFASGDTKPFPAYLQDEIYRNIYSQHDHLTVHPMVLANDFGVVSWWVCAPQPKPANATGVDVQWHYTVRTGVNVSAIRHDDEGCVSFIATQGPDYKAMPIHRKDVQWSWDNVNQLARDAAHDNTLNVHDKIWDRAQTLAAAAVVDPLGTVIAIAVVKSHIDATPAIDGYDPLQTLLDYHIDLQQGVVVSDAQPYPFYGWANVSWKTAGAPALIARAKLDPTKLTWGPADASLKVLTLSNVGTGPLNVKRVTIVGPQAADYSLAVDQCSGKVVGPGQSCIMNVSFKPSGVGSREATLSVEDDASDSPQQASFSGAGLIGRATYRGPAVAHR